MHATCLRCGVSLDSMEMPRYDVLKPDVDLDHPEMLGPYCGPDFANTDTGQAVAAAGGDI